MLQNVRQIFTGMLASAEEERNARTRQSGDNARSKQTGAFRIVLVVWWRCFLGAFSHQFQDLDGRIVVVDDVALACLPYQFFVSRSDQRGRAMDNVPLGRGCQGDFAIPLQPLKAVEW